jgi:predicted metal-binding membrane protein
MTTGITTAGLMWRDRAVLLGSAALVTFLGWAVMLQGHGGGPFSLDRIAAPHAHPPGHAGFLATFAMWMAMMTGMMLPAVLPWILLFAAGSRSRNPSGAPYLPTSMFVSGYLAIWALYSLGAAVAQRLLSRWGALEPLGLELAVPVGGVVLIGAGLFQLTPLKAACLRHCRSPLAFLMSRWRDGPVGAFRLGLGHGAYCVACCWALMAVGFAVGVMNLAWMAVLTVALCVEKIAPGGAIWSRLFGVLLIVWGALRFVA